MTVVPYTREPTQVEVWGSDPGSTLEIGIQIADRVGNTDFVPASMRNNPPAIIAAVMYGAEVGLRPMRSLAMISIINGRPTLYAEAQRALILNAGHDLWIEESTPTRCTVAGRRRNSEATSRVTWTMDDAKRAGLAGKQPWRTYPRQMLLARASAELARAVFPDAIGGLAATEELDGDEVEAGVVAETKPAAKTTRRKRASNLTEAPPPPPVEVLPPLPAEEQALVEALEQELGATTETPLGPMPAAGADEIPFGEPTPEPEPATTVALGHLNRLVGKLRREEKITTLQLWKAVAQERSIGWEDMVELLGGCDEDGVVHWSPLRESLTAAETETLTVRLSALLEDDAA